MLSCDIWVEDRALVSVVMKECAVVGVWDTLRRLLGLGVYLARLLYEGLRNIPAPAEVWSGCNNCDCSRCAFSLKWLSQPERERQLCTWYGVISDLSLSSSLLLLNLISGVILCCCGGYAAASGTILFGFVAMFASICCQVCCAALKDSFLQAAGVAAYCRSNFC